MGSWRRNAGEIRIQDPHRARSLNTKPPHGGSRQAGVPTWEKQFCRSVGSVPWGKLLEAKRVMYLYDNIVKWNDSAGEEAFSNAKKRFYAEINGLPCDISLPDPDKYIDVVDWNTDVDPNLLLDLERGQSGNADSEDGAGKVIFGDVLLNETFACTGWGDTEEAFQKAAEFGNPDPNADGMKNSWDHHPPQKNVAGGDTGWGNQRNGNSWEDNHWNNCNWNDNRWNDNNWDNNQWSNSQGNENNWNDNHWTGNNWNEQNWKSNHCQLRNTGDGRETWDWNNRHGREFGGGYMPRYKVSRFRGNNNQTHRGWRNSRGMRRDDLAYQQSTWIGTH